MQHSENENDKAYRKKFHGVRPIIEKHFVGFEQKIITDMTHRFIIGEEFDLFESWNFKEQQDNMTKLRTQFQQAKKALREFIWEFFRKYMST